MTDPSKKTSTMLNLTRRNLLQTAGISLAALPLSPLAHARRAAAWGAAQGKPLPSLVVIYLRGGADAVNIVVPYSSKRYYQIRPTLAIAPPGEAGGALKLDNKFGLHPSLADLMPFWKSEQLAPIVNVGSPHATRSHFDAQDFMEYAAPGLRTMRNGWLNRYLFASKEAKRARSKKEGEKVNSLRAIAMQGLLPRSLRGSQPALAVPDKRVLEDDEMLAMFGPLYGDMTSGGEGEMGEQSRAEVNPEIVYETGRNTLQTLRRFREIVDGSDRSNSVKYPSGSLASKLRDLAQVIRADEGLEIAALDVNGWDTHANQGSVTGAMPNLLAGLGGSLAAFMTDLGPRLEHTVIMVMSEFGRTCRENGNYGTDHGHGGMMMLMGGGVKGGKVFGKWAGLEDSALYQGRDLTVTTDFRDVFSEVLRKHMGFDAPRDFFPDYSPGRVSGLIS